MASGGEESAGSSVGDQCLDKMSVPLGFLVGFLETTDREITNRVDDLATGNPDIFAGTTRVNRAIAETAYEAGRRATLDKLATALMHAGYLPEPGAPTTTQT